MVSLFKYWLQEVPRPVSLASEDVEKTTTQMKAWFALTVKVNNGISLGGSAHIQWLYLGIYCNQGFIVITQTN